MTFDGRSTARPGTARLTVRNLACRRGERLLFDRLDLELFAGDVLWLRAANGYGKTTLLRVLAGIGRAEEGSIAWADRCADRLLYLGHANALKDDLTVAESLRLMVALHRLTASEGAIDDAIARFGLTTRRDAPVRTLSQGQRRRVALLRLCVSHPRATWILDEPFDALDADGSALVGSLVVAHAARGGSVLLTSHSTPPLPLPLEPDAALRTMQLDALAA